MSLGALSKYFWSNDEEDEEIVDEYAQQQLPPLKEEKQKFAPLLVKSTEFTIVLATPSTFEQARECADHLLSNKAVILDYSKLAEEVRAKVFNYLNGVVYVENARVERITEEILIYGPKGTELSKAKKNTIFS